MGGVKNKTELSSVVLFDTNSSRFEEMIRHEKESFAFQAYANQAAMSMFEKNKVIALVFDKDHFSTLIEYTKGQSHV